MSTSTTERRSWSQGRALTPEQVKARKQFIRKQKTEDTLLAAVLVPFIVIFTAITVVVALVLTFVVAIAGLIAIGFGIIDLATNGFNVWALIWVAVGISLVILGRPKITTK